MNKNKKIILIASGTLFLIMFFKISFIANLDAVFLNINISNNLKKALQIFTIAGDYRFLLFLILFICLVHKKGRKIYKYIIIKLSIATIIIFFLKLLTNRARPDITISTLLIGSSFPSGHTTLSILFYGFIMYMNNKFSNKWYINFLSFLIIFTVISSRIFLNYHYFSDILAGIFLGIFLLTSFLTYFNNKYID